MPRCPSYHRLETIVYAVYKKESPESYLRAFWFRACFLSAGLICICKLSLVRIAGWARRPTPLVGRLTQHRLTG